MVFHSVMRFYMKILLIEDEKRMAEAVCELLKQEGYEVEVRLEVLSGFDAMVSGDHNAVICDVMLPNLNGFEIVKAARKEGVYTPVLMLTAKSDLSDKVEGLDSGADDYLTKPFQVEELLARVRALLRRNAKEKDDCLNTGDLSLNTSSMTLRCKRSGKEIRLPEKEFRIMECLMSNKDRIISKEQLSVKAWGFENEAEYNNVEVYVSFTRKKLKFLETTTEIKPVRGVGYILCSQKQE